MTDAEKAEAAKADAAKKAEEEAKSKTKNGGAGSDDDADDDEEEEEEEDEPKETISKAQYESFKKKSNDENAKLRRELKAQKDRIAALADDGKEVDPAKKAKAEGDAKLRNSLLRAELAAVARDAHDPSALLKLNPKIFEDVEVDVENETFERDALEEAIEAAREKTPYLFGEKAKKGGDEETDDEPLRAGKKINDGGRTSGGSNHYTKWKDLQKSDPKAAGQYYVKNRAEILAQMKRNG